MKGNLLCLVALAGNLPTSSLWLLNPSALWRNTRINAFGPYCIWKNNRFWCWQRNWLNPWSSQCLSSVMTALWVMQGEGRASSSPPPACEGQAEIMLCVGMVFWICTWQNKGIHPAGRKPSFYAVVCLPSLTVNFPLPIFYSDFPHSVVVIILKCSGVSLNRISQK